MSAKVRTSNLCIYVFLASIDNEYHLKMINICDRCMSRSMCDNSLARQTQQRIEFEIDIDIDIIYRTYRCLHFSHRYFYIRIVLDVDHG
jgi:hypothetical protein